MTTTFDQSYTLEDRYERESGRVYLNGHQALVRVLLMQHERDQAAGLHTGGFVSGYRGSPLGVLDMALWSAADQLGQHDVHFQPGVNEELAATSVWGTQQLEMIGGSQYDGVFGMWYGKGPGVDRAGDALKTANYAGTSTFGGVLTVCGDDHGARSSSLAHQSEYALISFGMPVLNPSSVQEYVDLGLFGYALSRFSGCWVGFLCVTDIVETSASIAVDVRRPTISIPEREPWKLDRAAAHGPLIEAERSLYNVRLPAAQELVRHNRLDRTMLGGEGGGLGIITCGKAYNDVRQALQSLGIDENRARQLGVSLYKVAMTWPLEPNGIKEFCEGKEHVLVIEEKRPLVEDQLKTILFGLGRNQPELLGKLDWSGQPFVSNFGELSASDVAAVLVRWIEHCTGEHLSRPHEPLVQLPQIAPAIARKPSFCSGCPHNISTKVPEGSVALGGIGCHGMAGMLPDRITMNIVTPMGAEGANWIGQAPFTSHEHLFQNLGDGTYYHSGILALRAAISADVNITYKILANDAVAMTGGQHVEGNVTAQAIAHQVVAEGVSRVAVLSDEPHKYRKHSFPNGVTVHDRSALDEIQRTFRELPGVTVIIYDQACAAEKRRLRKRKKIADPPKRLIINEMVCEGCGDCNTQSNCISLEPVETEFGRKRRIDQSSCNKDYSCLDGYCPSFVTVYGGELRTAEPAQQTAGTGDGGSKEVLRSAVAELADPSPRTERQNSSILVTGIGGAGIVTLGSIMAMAAHLEDKSVSVLNVLGMAQKNGAVTSHVRISDDPDDVLATRIGPGEADLVLGTDPVVTSSSENLGTIAKGKTSIVLDDYVQPTSDFATTPDLSFDFEPFKRRLARAGGDGSLLVIEATTWAREIFGDVIMSNMIVLGVACELGQLPVGADALSRAIELNGQNIEDNQLAFNVGRLAVADLPRLKALTCNSGSEVADLERERNSAGRPRSLAELVDKRSQFLVGYQGTALSDRYRKKVAAVLQREHEVMGPDADQLSIAVANAYFKLLAYKDEYEVARLYTDGSFRRQLEREFSGGYRIKLNLAPQVMNARDPRTNRAKKRAFGPWIFPVLKVLASGRKVRGTKLDPFGWSAHRRFERGLIDRYEHVLDEVVGALSAQNHELAVEIAGYPDAIRGYDSVKEDSAKATMEQVDAWLREYRGVATHAA